MADYKEGTVEGNKWQRVCRVVIENQHLQTPSLMFIEEEVINLGGGSYICKPVSNLSKTYDSTNELHSTIYNKLDELYVILRTERDLAEQNP